MDLEKIKHSSDSRKQLKNEIDSGCVLVTGPILTPSSTPGWILMGGKFDAEFIKAKNGKLYVLIVNIDPSNSIDVNTNISIEFEIISFKAMDNDHKDNLSNVSLNNEDL